MLVESLFFIIFFLVRVIVGGVFVLAGIAKLRAPQDGFINTLMGYQLFARPIAAVLSYILPWLELILGFLLILGLWPQVVMPVGMVLLLLFTLIVVINLMRGKRHPCGCFDRVTPLQWKIVHRNVLLTVFLLAVYIMYV